MRQNISKDRKEFIKTTTVIGRLDYLMNEPDTLLSGLLSHTTIPPCKLEELLDHAKRN